MRLVNSLIISFFQFRGPALEVPRGNSKGQSDFNMKSSGGKSKPPKGNEIYLFYSKFQELINVKLFLSLYY